MIENPRGQRREAAIRCTIGRAVIVAATAIIIVAASGPTAAPEPEPSPGSLMAPAFDLAAGQWFQARLYVVDGRVVFFAAPDRHPVYTKILDVRFDTPPIARSGTVKFLQEEANNAIGAQWDDLLVRECSPDDLAALDKAPPSNDAATLPDPRFAGGRILYQNDFSRPYFGTARPIYGAWRIHDGILECMDTKGWGVFDLGIEVSDCVLAFRFQRRNQPTTNWIGIAVRGGDKDARGQGPWIIIQERAKVILRAAGHRDIVILPDAPGAKQRVVFSVPSEGDRATTPRLALLPVRNQSARLDGERVTALVGARLMTLLGVDRSVELVARTEIQPILAELSLARSGLLDKDSAARAGKALSATYLLEGILSDREGSLAWEVVLRRTRDLHEVGRWTFRVEAGQPDVAIEQAGESVKKALVAEAKAGLAIPELPAALARQPPQGTTLSLESWPLLVPVPDFQPARWYEFRLFVVGRRVMCFAAAEDYPLYAKIFDKTYPTGLAAAGSIGLLQEEFEYSVGAKWDDIRVYECPPKVPAILDDPMQFERQRAILDGSAKVGRVLYENSFDSPELRNEKPLVGTWRVVGGTLQNTDSGSGWSRLDLAVTVRDCLVCFRVLRGDNSTTNWVGIAVRVDGPAPPANGAFVQILRLSLGQGVHVAKLAVPGYPDVQYRPDPVKPTGRLLFAPRSEQRSDWGPRIAVLPPRQMSGPAEATPLVQKAVGRVVEALAQTERADLVSPAESGPFLPEMRVNRQGLLDDRACTFAARALLADALLESVVSPRGSTVTLDMAVRQTKDAKTIGRWTVDFSKEARPADLSDVASSIAAACAPAPVPEKTDASTQPATGGTAIVAFRNLSQSAELDPLQLGLADMLFAHLSVFPQARLVERTQIARVLEEQKLSLSGLTESDAVRVGSLVGARRLIVGDFTRAGDEVRVSARVYDVETGKMVTAATAQARGQGFDPVLREIAATLAHDLNLAAAAAGRSVDAGSGVRTMEGNICFARAMAAKYQGRWREAAEEFARLALLEPRSSAWFRRYQCLQAANDTEAIIEAGRECLSRGDLLVPLTERQQWEIATDCAALLRRAGRYREALALLEPLKDLPGYTGRDIRNRIYWTRQSLEGRGSQPAAEKVELDFTRSPGDVRRQLNVYWERCNNRDGARIRELLEVSWDASQKAPDDGWADWLVGPLQWVRRYWQWGQSSQISRLEDEYVLQFCAKLRQRWPDRESVRRDTAKVLVEAYSRQKRWSAMVDTFLELAAIYGKSAKSGSSGAWPSVLKNWSGEASVGVSTSDESHISYLRQAALLCYRELKDRERGRQISDELIREYGLSYYDATGLIRYMAEQGHLPQFPSPLALIASPNRPCGGNDPMRSTWKAFLARLGMAAHGSQGSLPNDAVLSHYDLVVCVGTGPAVFDWSETERLRAFVARGGRLLLILGAPEGAQPLAFAHRPLLRAFGLDQQIDDRLAQATATPSPTHAGLRETVIRGAIPFIAPDESVIYKCSQGALAALLDHGAGRVAVLSGNEWIRPDTLPKDKSALLEQLVTMALAPSANPRLLDAATIFRQADRRLAQSLFRTATDVPQGWGPWYYYTRKHDPALLRNDLAAVCQTLDAIVSGEFPGHLKAEASSALANFYFDHTTDSSTALSLYHGLIKDHPETPAAGFAHLRMTRRSLQPAEGTALSPPPNLLSLLQTVKKPPTPIIEPPAWAPVKGSIFWAEENYWRAVAAWNQERFDEAAALCRSVLEGLPAGDPQRFKPGLLLFMSTKRKGDEAEAKRLRDTLSHFPPYSYNVEELVSQTNLYFSGGGTTLLLQTMDRMVRDRMNAELRAR
jgi:TolB-like protein